jgi:hypothetical protein
VAVAIEALKSNESVLIAFSLRASMIVLNAVETVAATGPASCITLVVEPIAFRPGVRSAMPLSVPLRVSLAQVQLPVPAS